MLQPPSPSRAKAPPDSSAALRVTHLSTTDVVGGAARAMQRLHLGLRTAGVDSRLFVAQRFGPDDPLVTEFNPLSPAPRGLGQLAFRVTRRWHHPKVKSTAAYLSPDWSFTGWRVPGQLPPADVLHLHWTTDLLDFRTLPLLAQRHPLVWTLHDMNTFTGGCHYTGECERYRETCGNCPQLADSIGEFDLTHRVIVRKRHALQQIPRERLTIVTPSRWLAGCAARSLLLQDFPIKVIPNGIDLEEFQPLDRSTARRRFGLPLQARIVLFVAESLIEPRKGFALLRRALEAVRQVPDVLLVTLGRGEGADLGGLPVQHLGSLHDPAALRAAYAAADVFALPSLQDNLPNTILEAHACGTPVVGFRTGGVGEAVLSGESGLLVPVGDSAAMGRALREILETPELRERFSQGAHRRAREEYSVSLQASRHAALYREILAMP